MSGFLIDTNVLSEYNRPGGPDAGVKRWLETTDRQTQHVSVITLAEIRKGSNCSPRGSGAGNLNNGSSRIWKHGFLDACLQWIGRLPLGGLRWWRKELGWEGRCLRSIR